MANPVFSGGTIAGDVLPDQTGRTLGNSSQRWDLYVNNFDISAFSGNSSIFFSGNNSFTGNNVFTGSNSFKNLNAIRFADQFPGADIGAKINAAVADCGTACTIYVPAAAYSYSTAIVLADGIEIEGAGQGATILTYTGTGIGLDFHFATRARVRSLSLVNATSATVLKLSGTHVSVEDVRIAGANSGKMLWVTGNGVSTQSNWVNISNVKIGDYDFTGVGLQVDHAVDVDVLATNIYSAVNGVTATNMLLDTGLSGFNAQSVKMGFGLNNLRIQNSTPGAGAYNLSPIYLFFDQVEADTASGGDGILFDSTLSSNIVDAHFTNSWAAAAGLNNAVAVVTSTANGIHISGGNGIKFEGRVRFNALNGVLIDNANAKNITIHDSFITANNQTNNADAHGVYISAASTNDAILNSTIGNVVDGGGLQKYGIKVSAVAANDLRIEANDLGNNVTGTASILSTGNYWIWGNMPSSAALQNIVWGGITMNNPFNIVGANTLALGSTVVGSLPSAASNTFAQIGVTDSSAIASEGQNCVGGGAVKAIAISNGTVWKCF